MTEPLPESRPIITLTTDFGIQDYYVAAMKGVLLRHCPEANIIDITHLIPRHDILAGSIALERAIDSFDAGTIHVAVIDPGVGSARRLLIVRLKGQLILCPDNGLITWPWRRHGPGDASELTWRPAECSPTFHGRDVLAPAAANLAAGYPISPMASPITDPVLLAIAPAKTPGHAVIIHIDHFGNATTNVGPELLAELRNPDVSINGQNVGAVRRSYSDVPVGVPVALIGSSGLLEIAIREGSAAQSFSLRVGDKVHIQ
jgi:S-adenosylmethionine hydrolase